VFIVAFLFGAPTSLRDPGILDGIGSTLQSCALAVSVSAIAINIYGIPSAKIQNGNMIVWYMIGCICVIIICIPCGIVPMASFSQESLWCQQIQFGQCTLCPDTEPASLCKENSANSVNSVDVFGQQCHYYAFDQAYICGPLTARITVSVAFTFIVCGITFINSILSCVAMNMLRRNYPQVQTTNTIIIQQPAPQVVTQPYMGYPQQSYPMQTFPNQPYPAQPYPSQPMPYPPQPYPTQPYPSQPQTYPGQPYPTQYPPPSHQSIPVPTHQSISPEQPYPAQYPPPTQPDNRSNESNQPPPYEADM